MGTTLRKTITRAMPKNAEVFTRRGERYARWTDGRGRRRAERVTIGRDGGPRIIVKARTWTARYRDGGGIVRETATDCHDEMAARSVLAELERRADRVRSGLRTAAEDSVLDRQASPITEHVEAYLEHLSTKRGKGGHARVNQRRVADVRHRLNRIVTECGFKRLRDLDRGAMDRWADTAETTGMGACTLNAYLSALTAFANWAVGTGRIIGNPFTRPPKRDERANPRHKRRALTTDELRRLLTAARLRPLAEYGRVATTQADAPGDIRRAKHGRRAWSKAPLTPDTLAPAADEARSVLRDNPDFIDKLERLGRERALIYKTLVLTGLRKGELTATTNGHLELDGPVPYIVLDAVDAKAGKGAELPLRVDLAADLREWVSDRLASLRRKARASGAAIPARPPTDLRLFTVPTGLCRVLDRDLAAAGIAKRDDRGPVIDVHALRHTFGTHLSAGGVSPRTAQAAMRHGSIDLTMNCYTDPKLLDVAGAMNVLPDLPLNPEREASRQRATGTGGDADGGAVTAPIADSPGNRATLRRKPL